MSGSAPTTVYQIVENHKTLEAELKLLVGAGQLRSLQPTNTYKENDPI